MNYQCCAVQNQRDKSDRRRRSRYLVFTFAEAAVTIREHSLEPGGLLVDEGGPDHVAGDGDPSVRGAVDVAPVDLVPGHTQREVWSVWI